MKLTSLVVLLIISIILGSCSLQKRIYRKGYNIVWNHKRHQETKQGEKIPVENIINREQPAITVSSEKYTIQLYPKSLHFVKDTCGDKLLLKNAQEILVKVVEITDEDIKYKRCDNIDGPVFSLKKNKVESIVYANGVKEKVIVDSEPLNTPIKDAIAEESRLKKELNWLGFYSLIALPTLPILFFVIFGNRNSPLLLNPQAILIGLGLSFLIVLTLAFISLFQFRRNYDKYKGKWMPVLTIMLILGYSAAAILIGLLTIYTQPELLIFLICGGIAVVLFYGLFFFAFRTKRKRTSTK